jgi:hypothetical protein
MVCECRYGYPDLFPMDDPYSSFRFSYDWKPRVITNLDRWNERRLTELLAHKEYQP